MVHNTQLELLVATNNAGKIREIQESLQGIPMRLRYLREFRQISTPEETGTTYEQNAVLKAISYSKQTGVCALADDSGLEVDALGGKPGVLSARYGGASDHERTQKLLTGLMQHSAQERTARFVCCMALAGWPLGSSQTAREDPRAIHVCQAQCEGRIGYELRGNNGFGYDPVFIPIGYEKTFGELPIAVKNVISHRAQTLAAMREFLNGWIAST